jgi:dTDP-4-dehydrorhamnose 3,5-epimerase
LHLQKKNSQAKIITVVQGEILDVVVDLRKNSNTYGKHFSIKISQNSNFSLFIPENFAHGFLCLSKNCGIYYKCTKYRDKNSETTIKWNDTTLGIKWPIKKPILSKKDKEGISFIDFK